MSKMKLMANIGDDTVEITSIDFKRRIFTYDFRGHLENTELLDDVEIYMVKLIDCGACGKDYNREASQYDDMCDECAMELMSMEVYEP